MIQKRIYKVISPIQKKDGGTFWLRCGVGYVNKDNSINIYLEALPCVGKDDRGLTLQIREMTEEELRERAEKRAAYAARSPLDQFHAPAHHAAAHPGPGAANDPLPF